MKTVKEIIENQSHVPFIGEVDPKQRERQMCINHIKLGYEAAKANIPLEDCLIDYDIQRAKLGMDS